MTKIDATDLTAMTDEELASLRATAALDSRHDPEASERLAVFEEEIARRLVAETREEAAEAERTRREIAGSTNAELEARRARLGGESPSVVREELGLVVAEQQRRRAARADEAAREVRGAERRVKEAAREWESALSVFAEATRDLADAIGARSSVRRAAFDEPPSWRRDQERVFERAAVVLAEALGRPDLHREPGSSRLRTTKITELI